MIQRLFWEITDDCWDAIRPYLRSGLKTLETGSGRSTELFEDAGCAHVALEHDPRYAAARASVVLAALTGDPPWYDWTPPHAFDVVLIDGPPWWVGRSGVKRVLPRLLHADSVVIVDDTHRREERILAEEIAAATGFTIDPRGGRWRDLGRAFSVLRKKEDPR
jgi:hypothetical protein